MITRTTTVLAAALLLAGCSGGGKKEDQAAQPVAAAMDGADMGGMPMGAGPMRITARQASLAGVSYAIARNAELNRTVRAVATVVPDESRMGIVNARVSGWIERLYANETGRHVEVGEALFELYAPDLITAQEELLLAVKLSEVPGAGGMVEAARRRLALWGISDSLVTEIERVGEVRRTLTIFSPFTGHILEKSVIEGQHVAAGESLYRIADLSNLWIEPEIFEQDINLLATGQPVEIVLEAIPGRRYRGRVTFIYPTLDPDTRTLRVRVEVSNPGREIRPMMYATVLIRTHSPRGTIVPLTSVLPAGDRDLAFVVRGDGVQPVEVTVGLWGDSTVLVTDGLTPGDTVVASATFLFDSESNLAAALEGIMLDMGMGLDMGGMNMGGMDMGSDSTGAPMDMENRP
ncbi:MAG: efflux RND transporter periplasmic adaptor subunit [Gemmatimonadota bacterium]|nr:MAG: efflux RND transporter periplasmic adaptor subunit [Gemmatimonadota bacterium]